MESAESLILCLKGADLLSDQRYTVTSFNSTGSTSRNQHAITLCQDGNRITRRLRNKMDLPTCFPEMIVSPS